MIQEDGQTNMLVNDGEATDVPVKNPYLRTLGEIAQRNGIGCIFSSESNNPACWEPLRGQIEAIDFGDRRTAPVILCHDE